MAGGNTATHPPMGHTKAEPLMAPTDGELGITLVSSVGLLAVPVWLGLQWGCRSDALQHRDAWGPVCHWGGDAAGGRALPGMSWEITMPWPRGPFNGFYLCRKLLKALQKCTMKITVQQGNCSEARSQSSMKEVVFSKAV